MEKSQRRIAASWGAILGFVIGFGESMIFPLDAFDPRAVILATTLVGLALGAILGRRPWEAVLRLYAWLS